MAETFTCENCGGTFEKQWSDDDAAKEARDLWGVNQQDDPTMAVICNTCFTEFMAWYREKVKAGK